LNEYVRHRQNREGKFVKDLIGFKLLCILSSQKIKFSRPSAISIHRIPSRSAAICFHGAAHMRISWWAFRQLQNALQWISPTSWYRYACAVPWNPRWQPARNTMWAYRLHFTAGSDIVS
jgi:hypothetical protein